MNAYKPQAYKGRAYNLPDTGSGGGAPSDPLFSNVSVLLHFDNVGAPTTILDSSSIAHSGITCVGNATQSGLVTEYGSGALKLDGNGDWLSMPDHASINLGNSDFQISADVYLTAYATNNAGSYFSFICAKDGNGAVNRSYGFYIQGTASSFTTLGFQGFLNDTTSVFRTGAFNFSLNTWYHVKVIRKANRIYLCVNNEIVGTGEFTYNIQAVTRPLTIGSYQYDITYVGYFAGYMEEFRITKGDARLGEAFIRPSLAYPNS